MTELDPALQDEIKAAATRFYWQAQLLNGHQVPTRRLISIAQQAIQAFHDAGVNRELPRTEMSKFIDAAEAWLERQRGRIWKLAAAEEEK
jgi:hypothetical protein